jgi:hypothetical protein
MSREQWDALTNIERAFFVNAYEFDILPGVFGYLTEQEKDLPLPELAAVLMSLINEGWMGLHRYILWATPDGRLSNEIGDPITGDPLTDLLADPGSWDYRAHPGNWAGAPTLVTTAAGLKICRVSPEEPEKQHRV